MQRMNLWYLDTEADVQDLLAASESSPIWVLKHSDECDLSAKALAVFEQHRAASPLVHCVIVVQDAPRLSRLLEEQLAVRHETPQALLIVNRMPRWSASHRRITFTALIHAEM